MRYTERHGGVAVIKDKSKRKEAMEKLAKVEDKEEEKQVICGKCFNARMGLDENLDDDNDFSSFSIGHGSKDFRMLYTAGNGKPPRIEAQQWDERVGWYNVGIYYPKYCPECGREITEYGKINKER